MPNRPTTDGSRVVGLLLLLDLLGEDRRSWRRFLAEEIGPSELGSDEAFREWIASVATDHPELITRLRGTVRSFRSAILGGTGSDSDDA